MDYKKIYNGQKEKFNEDEFYLIFVLGYDLLHNELMKCDNKCCDDVFDTLKEIVELFLNSEEYKKLAYSTYDALKLFLENNIQAIKMILFNSLDYPVEEMLCWNWKYIAQVVEHLKLIPLTTHT